MITVVVMLVQAVLVVASTRLVGMINSGAVGLELTLVIVVAIALFVAVAVPARARSATSPREVSPRTPPTISLSAAG